jgi:hypothetical protein
LPSVSIRAERKKTPEKNKFSKEKKNENKIERFRGKKSNGEEGKGERREELT